MSDARYVWVDNLGYVKVGEDGIPDVQQHVNDMNAGLRDPSNTDIRVANTGNHSWAKGHMIDINPNDYDAIMAMYNDPDWNPFYDRYYAFGDRPGVENNVADYLYGLTKDDSQAHNRDKVMRQYQQWLLDSGTGPGNVRNRLTARDMMNAEMSQGMFDALGLGDLGYQYQAANQPADTPANEPANTPAAEEPPPPPTTEQQLTGLFGNDWQRGTKRTGTWGSGHSQGFTSSQVRDQAKSMYEQNPSLLGEDTESMRKAVITALENKILG